MARTRTRWNVNDRQRPVEQIASAFGAIIWKQSGAAVVELENENFEIETYSQRLDVVAEFCAYQLQLVDRLMYLGASDEAQRQRFVTALALHLGDTMQDNRVDAEGAGEYRRAFVALLNERMDWYATCAYSEPEGPSFVMRRNFGDRVAAALGPRQRKWATDYVMDVQAPPLFAALKRALPGLLG